MHASIAPTPEILTPDHTIVSYLSDMTNNTLNKMIYVLTNFTLEQMNMLRPAICIYLTLMMMCLYILNQQPLVAFKYDVSSIGTQLSGITPENMHTCALVNWMHSAMSLSYH